MPWVCDHPLCSYRGKRAKRCPVCGRKRMHWHPTQADIRAACEAIRAGWSERELDKRCVLHSAPVDLLDNVYGARRHGDSIEIMRGI